MFTINADHVAILRRVADRAEVTLRLDYSGRGMFGRHCVAITTEAPGGLFAFGFALGTELYGHPTIAGASDLAEAIAPGGELTGVRSDAMGHGTVYYWPGLATWTEPARADA
jgi:hypothetical protein